MGDISPNFNRSEFACKCGCGFDTVDVELIPLCEIVRELNGGVKISPSSGCRCASHNKKAGGYKRSLHMQGRAGDFHVSDPVAVYIGLCRLYEGRYGFGLYEWGVHIDTRSGEPWRSSVVQEERSKAK